MDGAYRPLLSSWSGGPWWEHVFAVVSYLRPQFPLASSPVLAPLALGFSVSPAWSRDSQDPGDLPGIPIFQA